MTVVDVEALEREHERLVDHGRRIVEARGDGIDVLSFDGVGLPIDEADELTRAAIYAVELRLEAAGVLAPPLGGDPS